MSGSLTEITEITTALGMLAPDLDGAIRWCPPALHNVGRPVWDRLVAAYASGEHADGFRSAFANGQAFLRADDGLRGRRPRQVEWKGPHQPPGDDVIPCDLRIDHVYLVSCKYLSRVLLNAGPQRLFARLLVGEERSPANWFRVCAPHEFQTLYRSAVSATSVTLFPDVVDDMTRAHQETLRHQLRTREWPEPCRAPWASLCRSVATGSADRWRSAMPTAREQLRVLWRLLRISDATYFVLGAERAESLRLRIDSAWDWQQHFELCTFDVTPRDSGQPEVAWHAAVRGRDDGRTHDIDGHVEIRWSHGRFNGAPEAKVYLDTPLRAVPGYHALA
jgi:hypothetical protein